MLFSKPIRMSFIVAAALLSGCSDAKPTPEASNPAPEITAPDDQADDDANDESLDALRSGSREVETPEYDVLMKKKKKT